MPCRLAAWYCGIDSSTRASSQMPYSPAVVVVLMLLITVTDPAIETIKSVRLSIRVRSTFKSTVVLAPVFFFCFFVQTIYVIFRWRIIWWAQNPKNILYFRRNNQHRRTYVPSPDSLKTKTVFLRLERRSRLADGMSEGSIYGMTEEPSTAV